jgi:hypothetical protein
VRRKKEKERKRKKDGEWHRWSLSLNIGPLMLKNE